MITRDELINLYETKKQSVSEIAELYNCSENKINYWLRKYSIPKRTISEAIYNKFNPLGDPFSFQVPKNVQQGILYGLGLGLYWGEGNKANKTAVRLGNTNPLLVKVFIRFLENVYKINKNKLRFGLQIFSDIKPNKALKFWQKFLSVSPSQFQKVIVSKVRAPGTYRNKSEYGVLTVYYCNKKLRDLIVGSI